MPRSPSETLLEQERFELKPKSDHRHYMGIVEAVAFVSYEATLERFQQEWVEIVDRSRGRQQ